MRVLIVGAGISGLSMALALEKIGIMPTIIEKSPCLRADGAGIALPRNAVELLTHLGLKNHLLKMARTVRSITYSLPNGSILSKANLSDYFSDNYPFVGIQRKDLIELMGKHLVSDIQFNTLAANINYIDEKETRVTFSNGNSQSFDLIIAADGVNSSIRKLVSPDITTEDLGLTIIRFLASYQQIDPVYYFGKQSAFMIYPVNKKQAYCYGHIAHSLIKHEDFLNNIQVYFNEYTDQIKELIEVNKQDIILGKLLSVSDPVLFNKKILFVGDASHACSPMLQQGAASALEDAVTFSTFLERTSNIDYTLKHYEQFRKPRINWVTQHSDLPLKLISSYQNEEGHENIMNHIRKNGPLNVLKWRELFSKDYLDKLGLYIDTNL